MVGLEDVAAARAPGQRPGPAAQSVVEPEGEGEIHDDVAEIVADAVDELARRRGPAGHPGEVAVGAVDNVPERHEAEAGERVGRPGEADERPGRGDEREQAPHRDDVGRNAGRHEQPRQPRGERVVDEQVQRVFEFTRPASGPGEIGARRCHDPASFLMKERV